MSRDTSDDANVPPLHTATCFKNWHFALSKLLVSVSSDKCCIFSKFQALMVLSGTVT